MRAAKRLALAVRYGLGAAPLFTCAVFIAFVGCARHQLGHFPTPMRPDPKGLDQAWLMLPIALGFMLSLIAARVWPFLADSWRDPERSDPWSTRLFLSGWTCLIFIMTFDPGRFVDWFFD